MTESLLMLGLWAAHRWSMPLIPLVWMAVTSSLWLCADICPGFRSELSTIAQDKWASATGEHERIVVRHPLANLDRMSCWPQCWDCGLSKHEKYVLWDRIKQIRDFEASIGWEELEEVVEFLNTEKVKDREVIAWHDSPHAAYLMLGKKPGIRFMHTTTAQLVCCKQLQTELIATNDTARFLIGDLEVYASNRCQSEHDRLTGPPGPRDLLPADMTDEVDRKVFPYDQPVVVFRSLKGKGRYTVHRLVPPYGRNLCPP